MGITTTHHLESEIDGSGIAVVLIMVHSDNKMVRYTLHGNGRTYSWASPGTGGYTPAGLFLLNGPEHTASKFDQLGIEANAIDSAKLIEHLLPMAKGDPDLEARINNLVPVGSANDLFAVAGPLMVELYGYNWVTDALPGIVQRSDRWLALVDFVRRAQTMVKQHFPT